MITDKQKEIVKALEPLDWEGRYKAIIERGKTLPTMDDEYRIDKYKVKGCQSQVWIHAQLDDRGQVVFVGDSDALIVKGLLSVLLEVFSGRSCEEIVQAPLDFIAELGFDSHLSPSRANGFMSMVKQIRLYAMAFQMMKGGGVGDSEDGNESTDGKSDKNDKPAS